MKTLYIMHRIGDTNYVPILNLPILAVYAIYYRVRIWHNRHDVDVNHNLDPYRYCYSDEFGIAVDKNCVYE